MYFTVKIILGVLQNSNKGKQFFCTTEISRRNLYSPNLRVLRYEGKETHLTTRIDEVGSTGHLFIPYFKKVVYLCRLLLLYYSETLT
jgi:hypothetical protein